MIFNGRYLKAARQRANLTQDELGQAIGVSGVTIMRYETNQRKPSNAKIDLLVKALGVSRSYLAVGVTQEEWDSLEDNYQGFQGLLEFGEADNITEAQPVLDFCFPDMSRKENKAFNDLASNYKKLSYEGMTEAAKRVEELTHIPKYQRLSPQRPLSDED